jgi:arylformamidase
MRPSRAEYRAVLDVRIGFLNGGSLSADGFRLDIPSAHTSETEIARLLVQHLGLALVGEVDFDRLEIVAEQHKGSRGVVTTPSKAADTNAPQVVDLSIPDGTVLRPHVGTLSSLTLESVVDLPAEVFHLSDVTAPGIPASAFYDRDIRGKAVLIHTGGGDARRHPMTPLLCSEALLYLASQNIRLVGIDTVQLESDPGNGGPAAQVFLRTEGCHVVENLTDLALLPASGSRFSAVPLTNASGDAMLVRAFAMTHTPLEEE